MARKRKWTAAEVVHALRTAYGVAGIQDMVTEEWAFLTEVPLRSPRAGYEHQGEGYWSNTRTIDIFMVRNWTSGVGHQRVAVEVKVSKSDYRNETDLKRLPAERSAHRTYYAAPAGIIDPATLPEGWGLYEVYATKEEYDAAPGWQVGAWVATYHRDQGTAWVKCTVRAAKREPVCDLEYLTSAGMRRASRAEERIRRGADDAAKVPALLAQVKRLEGQLERRDGALADAQARVKVMAGTVAAMEGGQVCSECREPIVLDLRNRSTHGIQWRHTDRAQDGRCEEARAEADRLAKEKEFGSRYMRGWAMPVQPLSLAEHVAALDQATADS